MESLANDKLIPIGIKSFIMGFDQYRTIWTPHENKVVHACMEPTNKKDKFAVAVIGHKNSVVGHLIKRKSGQFAKTICEYHGGRVRVAGKAANQRDDKGMKIPCILIFKRQ